ncbi:hypothetical protein TTHERM_000300549 (macronuclear) [Tetrahymena thermophila SB210]|uniref:Uncharacterized protein n=1 Tax=Tetrahymena thermophila (strain SB210) TaxID=312017 RepID=W7X351_TETTS|nr:hypothetical protein TTHERM_000300549 [Tetrahymena thermophila SB210]EWS71872.1 hypothetical protein TTHERM_000300549 [Tetrahymena thermophila SB210]|eukprot:XP_012655616.1 hypothetical protein TTHERM_000300549 [Tetrahymena thermophila SB210]
MLVSTINQFLKFSYVYLLFVSRFQNCLLEDTVFNQSSLDYFKIYQKMGFYCLFVQGYLHKFQMNSMYQIFMKSLVLIFIHLPQGCYEILRDDFLSCILILSIMAIAQLKLRFQLNFSLLICLQTQILTLKFNKMILQSRTLCLYLVSRHHQSHNQNILSQRWIQFYHIYQYIFFNSTPFKYELQEQKQVSKFPFFQYCF